MSIRLRLTLWYTAILAIIVILFGGVMYVVMQDRLYASVKEDLQEKSEEVVNTWIRYNQITKASINTFESYFFQLVDADTRIITQSENLNSYAIPVSPRDLKKSQNPPYFKKQKLENGVTLLVYYAPVVAQGKELVVYMMTAKVINEIERYLADFRLIYSFSATVLVALAASLGLFMARKALKPIDHVITAAEQIERADDLSHRILYDGPKDEIGRLIEKINGMLDRIQLAYDDLSEAYRAQRRFVSDASHELRTPLTTIRGNIELIMKMRACLKDKTDLESEDYEHMTEEAVQDVLSETERMSRLVNDMLSLARADAGYEMRMEETAVRPLVEEVVRRAEFLPRQSEWITGDLSALDGQVVYGNKDYLQQLLFIFIDNAFKYTPEGTVRLDALQGEGQVGIRIQDTGLGMDEEEVPHIFERFYRADVSRGQTSGTGLGLSIAKWIIDEHHGSIEVHTSKGRGTTFTIWLPVAFLVENP
ncbi:sensor histidine kinase [Marinicrinis lubricantis]|uniref:histidine kinase n=1 Tax=Marinicrinis lubricantis TaxID=2086470 RepID=A0ABW1IPZ7_9BACL